MKAPVLFGAGWENEVEVLWRDTGRVFCRLWRNDAEGEKHPFIPISAGVEHPTLDGLKSIISIRIRRAYAFERIRHTQRS
jgi:hypothetical protein